MPEFYDPDARPANVAVPKRKGLPKLSQSSKWTCLPTSFAMVLAGNCHDKAGHLLASIMEQLGRDDERGFHVQEFLGIAATLGFAFTPFEFAPELERAPCPTCRTGEPDIREWEDTRLRREECKTCLGTGFNTEAPLVLWPIENLMKAHDGVLTGKRKGATHWHAVAWCKETQLCLDPEEGIYRLENFEPLTFWAAFEIL